MKELPILFSTVMVEALLEGRKKKTRRTAGLKAVNENPSEWRLRTYLPVYKEIDGTFAAFVHQETGETIYQKAKYCPGDILYVRETWVNLGYNNCHDGREQYNAVVYKASENGRTWEENMEGWRWKPGIHLRKEDCRIWLKCTGVRAERACDISEEDAIAEGIRVHVPVPGDGPTCYRNYLGGDAFYNPVRSFQSLWYKINGPKTWNNWVWVYDFDIISTTGKPADL